MGDFPVVQIVLGGSCLGAGMVLTRGCVGRLTVLGATGNLRAVTALLIFAVVAHATLKGVLSPLRTAAGGIGPTLDAVSLSDSFGNILPLVIIAAITVAIIWRSGSSIPSLAGWCRHWWFGDRRMVGTGFILYDDFDPIAFESIAFTSPWTDSIFWTLASTSVSAKFGVGLVGGVIAGICLRRPRAVCHGKVLRGCPFRSLCGGRIVDGIWWCSGRRLHNWCGPIGIPASALRQSPHFWPLAWRSDHTSLGDVTPSTYGSDGQGTIPHQQPAE